MRMYDQARAIAAQQVAAQTAQMAASDDPVEQAGGRYMERMTNYWNEQTNLVHEGAQIIVFRVEGAGDSRSQLTNTAIIGVLVALLLPAVQAAREAARRNASLNNMKQILLALLNYEAARRSLPAYANFSPDGKPLLSWRVHLLPFMEQQVLYQQFHLDEPWDSPHNKALIPQMPAIFLDPSSGHAPTEGLTHYLGVKGEGRYFDGTSEGRKLIDMTDGTSNTIAFVQVNDDRTVIWTKPEDWEMNDATPFVGLGALHPGIFLAGFADGHVTAVSTMIDVTVLKAMLTISGGEALPVP
jgi:type II secretory pathway pseudopilin PulG